MTQSRARSRDETTVRTLFFPATQFGATSNDGGEPPFFFSSSSCGPTFVLGRSSSWALPSPTSPPDLLRQWCVLAACVLPAASPQQAMPSLPADYNCTLPFTHTRLSCLVNTRWVGGSIARQIKESFNFPPCAVIESMTAMPTCGINRPHNPTTPRPPLPLPLSRTHTSRGPLRAPFPAAHPRAPTLRTRHLLAQCRRRAGGFSPCISPPW